MSKIDRKRLSRGAGLTPEHIFDPITDGSSSGAAYQINQANIEPDQLQTPNAPFRVNLHIPYIASDISDDPDQALFGVPFTLPPLQEFFSISAATAIEGYLRTPSVTDATPRIILDEVSFSFDQRAEGCAIADQFWGQAPVDGATPSQRTGTAVQQGYMSFDGASDLSFRISIREKTPMLFTATDFPSTHDIESVEIGKEVFGTDISSNSFTGDFLRNNPFVTTDINKSINPYSTYMFIIDVQNIMDPTLTNKTMCLPSVNISMRFRHPLVTRDYGPSIQNLPDSTTPNNQGVPTSRASKGESIVITEPVAGNIITADGAGGVSNELASIDKVFKDGLKGGYDREGMPPALEELQDSAGYEVIAVPLFNNRLNGGVLENTVGDEPFATGVNTTEIWDSRIIPLSHPITVHHVILAWNWSTFFPSDSGTVLPGPDAQLTPDTSTFAVEVGVAAGTMLRSDAYAYNQIAYSSINQPSATASTPVPQSTWSTGSIDRIKFREQSLKRKGTGGAYDQTGLNAWDWELHQVPILGGGSPAGAGYYPQGKPFYLGRNWSLNENRLNVYNIAGSSVAPQNMGCEQFIEVRMKIGDSAGLEDLQANSLVSGYGGHFVYIIGKKHLT